MQAHMVNIILDIQYFYILPHVHSVHARKPSFNFVFKSYPQRIKSNRWIVEIYHLMQILPEGFMVFSELLLEHKSCLHLL